MPLNGAIPIPADQVSYLVSTAARAPSVHNTQPWRFRINDYDIELLADPGRKLQTDPLGREMLLSCGAALFGLRLAVRSLGYDPVVELLPVRSQLRLLARIALAEGTPMTALERQMLYAVPRRHTHRGSFRATLLPPGLLAGMQHDAAEEGATLTLVSRSIDYERLADLISATAPKQDRDPASRSEVLRWSRPTGSADRDGVPARAFQPNPISHPGHLRQRDFDLGRDIGVQPTDGDPPAVTGILLTTRDRRMDWLKAGQALQRLLLHGATRWVFASLFTQPLESAQLRDMIRARLALPGIPQVLLQLGVVDRSEPTIRRAPEDVIE